MKEKETWEQRIDKKIQKEQGIEASLKIILENILKKFHIKEDLPIEDILRDGERNQKVSENSEVLSYDKYITQAESIGSRLFLRRFNLFVNQIEFINKDSETHYIDRLKLCAKTTLTPNVWVLIEPEIDEIFTKWNTSNEGKVWMINPYKVKEIFDAYIMEAGVKIFRKSFEEEFVKINVEK